METCDLHQHVLHHPEANLHSLNLSLQQLQTSIPEKAENKILEEGRHFLQKESCKNYKQRRDSRRCRPLKKIMLAIKGFR